MTRTASCISPANPDRLYQQNHCGIYRLDRPSKQWLRIGKNMPKSVGDVGFPIVPHPRNADQSVGVPDGRQRSLAAHQPERQTRCVRHAQRRPDVDSASMQACLQLSRGSPSNARR